MLRLHLLLAYGVVKCHARCTRRRGHQRRFLSSHLLMTESVEYIPRPPAAVSMITWWRRSHEDCDPAAARCPAWTRLTTLPAALSCSQAWPRSCCKAAECRLTCHHPCQSGPPLQAAAAEQCDSVSYCRIDTCADAKLAMQNARNVVVHLTLAIRELSFVLMSGLHIKS